MSATTIRVGDKVKFRMGRDVIGEVREDRGPIGVGGRRLYLIAYELDPGCWYQIELPLAEFEVIERKKSPA